MVSSGFFIGVDGGGTGCRARLYDAGGAPLAQGEGGPANIRLGLPAAWTAIMEAVDMALGRAGLDRSALPSIRAGLGLAGIVTEADRDRVVATAPAFAETQAASDAHTACLGAFSGRDGGIVIAGTGSAGHAVIGGRGIGIGGWGFEVSDDGSGAWIGRESVRAALHAHDGLIPASPFTRQVLDRLGGGPDIVVGWAGRATPGDYARFAPAALAAAAEGDPVAARIVASAGEAIAALCRRLLELGAPKVCLMGGLAVPLRPWLPAGLLPSLTEPEGDAMDGAMLLARVAAGAAP